MRILLIANCGFLYKTPSKESQEKENAMNNITRDHTPFAQAHVLVIANMHAFDLLSCKYIQLSIIKNESSIFQANCQHPAKRNCRLNSMVFYPSHMQFFVWQFAIIRIAIWLVQHHSQWFNYTFKTPVSNFHEDAQFWESLYSVRTEAT